jgi:hypothetical protein
MSKSNFQTCINTLIELGFSDKNPELNVEGYPDNYLFYSDQNGCVISFNHG